MKATMRKVSLLLLLFLAFVPTCLANSLFKGFAGTAYYVTCRVSATAAVDGCNGAPISAYNVSSGPGTYYFPNMLTATCAPQQIGCARQSNGAPKASFSSASVSGNSFTGTLLANSINPTISLSVNPKSGDTLVGAGVPANTTLSNVVVNALAVTATTSVGGLSVGAEAMTTQANQSYATDGAFNEAGKDYPVGNDAIALASLGLNPGTLIPLTVANCGVSTSCNGALPIGCVFNTTSGFSSVFCDGSANITLQGFNFSGTGFKCTGTNSSNLMTGHMTIKNNYFPYGANIAVNPSFYGLINLNCNGPATFENNVVDADGAVFSFAVASGTTTISLGDGGALEGTTTTDCGTATNYCFQYNAILHCLGRCITSSAVSAGTTTCLGNTVAAAVPCFISRYNFYQGFAYPAVTFLASAAGGNTTLTVNSITGGAGVLGVVPGSNPTIAGGSGADLFAASANFAFGDFFSPSCVVGTSPPTSCTIGVPR